MKNELRIPFESLLNRGIQRELVDPDNNNSFLNNTYTQAFTLIRVICETSKCMTDTEKNGKSRQDEIHNVIAFSGRRGTGKTSAMLSIADSLSKLSVEKENRFEISDVFVQLPYINAAVLDEEEDIFLIVLSRMFKELDVFSSGTDCMYNKDFHDKVRELKEEMCKIHGHYVNLKGKNDLTSSYYSMENLHAKYNIREEFAELVKNYTEFYKDYKTNKTTHLILCIDDVDMSKQDHMRIMQCIHQYFMVPRVIVMITLNFPVLTASLQKDTFERLKTIGKKDSQNLHLAFEHTHDFLRKIIPSDMRITMPSWRKDDYRNLMPVKIDLGQADNLNVLVKEFPLLKNSGLFHKLQESGESDYTLNPKQLILIMIADRTEIYLDSKGNKFHFVEPDSLRNLYDIFYMLYHMNDITSLKINENKGEYYREKKANRKILMDYLYFKLLPEYDFSSEEESLITDFLSDSIERRGKRIWDYYFKRLTSKKKMKRIKNIYGSDFYEKEKNKNKIENYSFGEVYRILYSASRLEIMNRNLIKFILSSFSFSLPQFVESERVARESDKTVKFKFYRNLRDTFGYTMLGTWCESLFGGKLSDTIIDTKKFDDFCFLDEKGNKTSTINCATSHFQAFIDDFLMLLLMSSRSTRDPFLVQEDIRSNYHIDNGIDPMAFIVNSLCVEERLTNMKFIKSQGKPYISDSKGMYSITLLLYDIIEYSGFKIERDQLNIVVRNKIMELRDVLEKNILWFFLEHTDLAYSVIKRAVCYILYGSDLNLRDIKPNRRTPFETIQKFYEIIYDKLKEEDDLYFLKEECEFSKHFKNNKMVKLFCDNELDKSQRQYRKENEVFKHGCGIITYNDDNKAETRLITSKTNQENNQHDPS